ncbi:MAG: hypothetical protein CMJ59_12325 [Planctomycetaceae bacterium]|nr:hypothetical protein [Planctomycetaceae bacterium]
MSQDRAISCALSRGNTGPGKSARCDRREGCFTMRADAREPVGRRSRDNPPEIPAGKWFNRKSMNTDQPIVPGIVLSASGQATVDPSLADVLFDLAIQLEQPTDLPVDVQHVLAAIVLAARQGQLDSQTPLSRDDPALVNLLTGHVKTIFEDYDGRVGSDD